jgi:hypothetical protein
MPPLLSGAPLSFTSDCTDERSPERTLEEPLISALENGLDFFGLRLLTPLRPILFSIFLKSSSYGLERSPGKTQSVCRFGKQIF